MTKITFAAFIALIMSVTSLSAQGTDPFDVQMRVYKSALKNYDLQTATIALYNMQAIKPERTDLNDSLAIIYFTSEKYAQAYFVANGIVTADPKRNDMLEMVAVSQQNLGMIKESLSNYEKLYANGKSVYYLYEMAILQYQLKRFGECIASLDQILANPDADKQKVNIRGQQGSQDVPMKAAAYNVKGICALEVNQPEAAKENFNKAISLFPDFVAAKGNLETLDKKNASGAKTPASTANKPAATSPAKPK